MQKDNKKRIIHELNFLKGFDEPTPDVFHKIIYKLFKPYFEGNKVLNIGCWTASFETQFKDDDCQITGVDISLAALKTAKEANPHCTFAVADAFCLPFEDNSFDVVSLFMVLEHIPKNTEPQLFKEVNRVLKIGGSFIITTPRSELMGNVFDVAHWLIGHRHYNVENLRQMLADKGFEFEKLMLKGGVLTNLSIPFFYLSKYLFKINLYKEPFIEKIITREYEKDGFRDIFLVCKKIKGNEG
jgi:ubiquinone/menaquinone biosynthesis C-methylase UbiE